MARCITRRVGAAIGVSRSLSGDASATSASHLVTICCYYCFYLSNEAAAVSKMVLSTILLCGAVPFQSPPPSSSSSSVELMGQSTSTPIHIVCCRCHILPQQHQPPDPSSPDLLLPDVVADSLPVQRRKIISNSNEHHQQETSTNKQQCSAAAAEEEEEDQVDLQDSNIGAKTLNQWRQVGRDLRIIADTFSSSSSPSTLTGSSRNMNQPATASPSSIWIWNVLLQGAVVYVGWKVHRWTSG